MISTKYGANLSLERLKMDGLTCSECGKTFEKPVLATISCGDLSKTYYACPRCLAKIMEASPPEVKRKSEKDSESRKVSGGFEENVCPHFFGFLKKRPKNIPIPDECLTCSKMIDCLT